MSLQFQSIAMQVAQALQAAIAEGKWVGALPAERQLAEDYQVSRKTVRRALASLRTSGVLQAEHRRGSLIASRHGPPRVVPSLRIGLLCPEPLERLRPFTVLWVSHLTKLLQEGGHHLQLFHGAKYYGAGAARALARLTGENPAQCWIIARSNARTQQWFAASGLPALIAGSALPGVGLPSVDVDHRALCRHCAALFLRLGHRRLAVFLEPGGLGGEVESEQGFREGLAAAAAEVFVCSPERSAPAVIRDLKRLLGRRGTPTALLLSSSQSYLTVVSYLGSVGFRVPRDISVVSRDDEPFLRFMHPPPAHYSMSPARNAHALHQGLQRILGGDRSAFAIRVMPELVKGGSVGPAKV